MPTTARFFLISWLVIACTLSASAQESPENTLEILNPWIRELPSISKVSALYLMIRNNGDFPVVLTSISSPISQIADIHLSESINGSMRMRKIDTLTIPAHGDITFKPMSYHIMLRKLKNGQPRLNDRVPFTLNFQGKNAITAFALVKKT